MSEWETIKSYLVSLGFKVDDSSYRKFQEALRSVDKEVERHTAGIVRTYLAAAATITGVLTSITAATSGLLAQTSKADLGYQKFALHMYMAAEQAKKIQDSDGRTWGEPRRHRMDPRTPPAILQARRFAEGYPASSRVRGADAMDSSDRPRIPESPSHPGLWRAMDRPSSHSVSESANSGIPWTHTGINRYLVENMPKWTEKVAWWLSKAVDMWTHLAKAVKSAYEHLEGLWKSLPELHKVYLSLGAIGGLFLTSGPFGRALIVLSSLLLLIDDYYGYLEGKSMPFRGTRSFRNGKP